MVKSLGRPPPEPKAVEVPSRRYGRYLVRNRLGQGGQAEVFLAEAVDERGEQVQVALKLMRPGASEESFAAEVDLMSILSHPNLVRLIEHGAAFGRPYLAMEFLIGGDLSTLLAAHRATGDRVPLDLALTVTLEVLKALAYFHTATTRSGAPMHLVHSDVNPANVFFSGSGDVKLGDFGVASSSRADIGPGEGVAAGKLSYLSPEQTRGEAVTPASDVWAVGVMLYELLVGAHPFMRDGATEQQVMAAIRAAKLSFPASLDKALANIVARALTPDLKGRYRTAGELAGPLFGYALDQNLLATPARVQEWLEGQLGLLV
jgi:serine/threonine-protein kinase